MDRLAIIGDVHGDARKLAAMLKRVPTDGRRLLFVGDYVNRGPDSRLVLDLLCGLQDSRERSCTFLLGNHEQELKHYLQIGDFARFASVGGIPTLRSYLGEAHGDVHRQFLMAFPDRHASFLAGLELVYKTAGLFVSHDGLDPGESERCDDTTPASPSQQEVFNRHRRSGALVVCGHYAQKTLAPFVSDGFVCVDSGCGTAGGPLTALLLPERTFIQVGGSEA